MSHNNFNKPHFFIDHSAQSFAFTSPNKGGGGSLVIPAQDRARQSGKLRGDLQSVSAKLEQLKETISDVDLNMGIGIQVEFESFPGIGMTVNSLANTPKGIELHNVKTVQRDGHEATIATVFVPDGKLDFYEKKISEYVDEKKDINNNARDHQKLIDSIKSIRNADFLSMWSDNDGLLPADKEEKVWCVVVK